MLSVNNNTSNSNNASATATVNTSAPPPASAASGHQQPARAASQTVMAHYAPTSGPNSIQMQHPPPVLSPMSTSTPSRHAAPDATSPTPAHMFSASSAQASLTPGPSQERAHLALSVAHLTHPPLGFSWGPSAYLRTALPEDMWRVAMDVLVETRVLAHCNFAVTSETLVANVPGLSSVPIDPNMPRASGSGARLVSLDFAVAVLVDFVQRRDSDPHLSNISQRRDQLDLGKLLAMRIVCAIDTVRALSAKYDHAQYSRAVQHNSLISWLSQAAGQCSSSQSLPTSASRSDDVELQDRLEMNEDGAEEDQDDGDDTNDMDDPIQVDSKLSSSTCSSHLTTAITSPPQLPTPFLTSPSTQDASSLSLPSILPVTEQQLSNSVVDTDDPMDCDDGGALPISGAITSASSSNPAAQPQSPPSLFVVFADTGRICRATGTADVIQALVPLVDILPWITQMRAEFGRHFVLLHLVPYHEAVAATESSSPGAALSEANGQDCVHSSERPQNFMQDSSSQPIRSHTHASAAAHVARQPSTQGHPTSLLLPATLPQPSAQHLYPNYSQNQRQQPQRHPHQHPEPIQQQGASIETLLSVAHLLG